LLAPIIGLLPSFVSLRCADYVTRGQAAHSPKGVPPTAYTNRYGNPHARIPSRTLGTMHLTPMVMTLYHRIPTAGFQKRLPRTWSCQRGRAHGSYTSAISTSGSSPSVAEKRTFGALSVRTVEGSAIPGSPARILHSPYLSGRGNTGRRTAPLVVA
jgi:hypothetical protein